MLVALHDIAVITTAPEIKLEFELDNKAVFEVVALGYTHLPLKWKIKMIKSRAKPYFRGCFD